MSMKEYVQAFILCLVMVFGFSHLYDSVWIILGFPLTVWSAFLTSALSGLSAYGFMKWVAKE